MIPSRTSVDPLRHVRLESGHVLRTYDTHRAHDGRTCIGYTLSDPSGFVLFAGEDFLGSPMHADDSDATVRELLGFLFLRPGDTDREYFATYTRAQLAFATSDTCELLAFIYSDAVVGTENEGELEDIDDSTEIVDDDGEAWSVEDYERAYGPHAARAMQRRARR